MELEAGIKTMNTDFISWDPPVFEADADVKTSPNDLTRVEKPAAELKDLAAHHLSCNCRVQGV